MTGAGPGQGRRRKWLPALLAGLAAAALAVGYGLIGRLDWTAGLVVLGGLWIAAQWLLPGRLAGLGLAAIALAAGLGILFDAGRVWMLAGLLAGLAAWDLESFYLRLAEAPTPEDAARLEAAHLRRLLLAGGLGLAAAGVALVVRFRLAFGVAFGLGLLAAFGLSQLIGFLRREGD